MTLAAWLPKAHGRRMSQRSLLDDPETAAHAWARYRRLMRFMLTFTTITVVLAFVVLYRENGMASAHLYIAAAIGIGFSMLLMSALMGLVFLSSATGHDNAVIKPPEDGA
jgi:predicted exporter